MYQLCINKLTENIKLFLSKLFLISFYFDLFWEDKNYFLMCNLSTSKLNLSIEVDAHLLVRFFPFKDLKTIS